MLASVLAYGTSTCLPGSAHARIQSGAARALATVRRASCHAISAVRPRGEAIRWPRRRARSWSFSQVGACARSHTPQVESVSSPAVQLAVQAGQRLLPRPADRPPGQGHQVQITDTGNVIPGGQGTVHQQTGHPAKAVQTVRKITYDRRHGGHPASLRPRISAQFSSC
jgi:hypothetical protein